VTLADLNAASPQAFVAELGHVFERSPWVAERVCDSRPFASIEALHRTMVEAVDSASEGERLALLRAHPELAGKAAVAGQLTPASASEQAGAGLTQCTPEEFARLIGLNARYRAKFGFPFIVAVKGLTRAQIIGELSRRLYRDRGEELVEAHAQVARIARLRLESIIER
jgi:2-oxo-4-hydroxy-4-carboxy-5-ureidoimidazoline decarboxylase